MTQELKEEFERFAKELSDWADGLELPEYLSGFQIASCLQNNPQKKTFLLQNEEGKQLLFKYACGEFARMLRTENELFGREKFSFIPYIIDCREKENEVFLLREYVPGSTLRELVEEEGALPLDRALPIIRKLCRSLSVLHGLNPPLIYRDIKPSNIVITENNDCYLVDMGTVRQYQEDGSTDTICMGTADFAAPEQFGARQTDARTDIYSLGLLFYYLLTGELKLRDAALSKLPAKAASLIRKCTDFNPDRRYPDVSRLQRDLDRMQPDRARTGLKIWAAAASVLAAISLALFLSPPAPSGLTPVTFDSPLLEQAVRQELGKKETERIFHSDLKQITSLHICGNQILSDPNSHENGYYPHHANGAEVATGNITDISLLAEMTNLQSLTLDHQKFYDITPLKGLPLISLSLAGTPVTDLSPLGGCDSLCSLDVSFCSVRSLEPLADCPSLSKLDCSCTAVKDLSPLAGLTITMLSIMDLPITDFSLLETFPLIQLNCRNFPPAAMPHLKKIPTLRYLNISNSSFTSLEDFVGIPALTELNLYGSSIRSLKGIEGLSGLHSLTLSDNPLSDASALSALPSLQYLGISRTGVTDFSFLKEMPYLGDIEISKTQLPYLKKAVSDPWFRIFQS